MSWLEINKILASIIVAIIVFIIIGNVVNYFANNISNENQETAYKIDIPENESSVSAEAPLNLDNIELVSDFLKTASLSNGEKIFKKCGTCHNYEKDGKSKVGPSLWNIMNSPKANVQGYAYSKALVEFGGKWTYEELSSFLYKPKDYIKGTKMNFAGLKKVQDRADLILFLREQSDNPISLP